MLWLVATLGSLSTAAAAVSTSQAVRATAEVTVVEVPVNVTGRDGKPVYGLSREDFTLEDDGVPQAIDSLDVVDLKRKSVDSELPSALPTAGRRHFLLLFDMSFASAYEIARSRDAAINFLQNAVAPEDYVAVATASIERGAQLKVTFSWDRRQALRAIRSVGLPNETERAPDPLAFAFVAPGDPSLGLFSQAAGDGKAANPSGQIDPTLTAQLYRMMAQKDADSFALNRVHRLLSQLDSLAEAMSTVEGRKTVIFFSEGFDGRLLVGNIAHEESREETLANNDFTLNGQLWALDIDRRYSNSPLQKELSDSLDRLRRADCVIYPIDIAGLKSTGDGSVGPGGRGEDSLFAFASATGGELIKNANNLSDQMRRIAEKTSLTYVLSFRPRKTSGQGKFHALRVKTRTRGARVSARSGYYESKDYGRMTPLERTLAASDVINHERNGGEIPLNVLAMAFPEQPLSRIPILIQVPGEMLVSADTTGSLDIGVYVYVVDSQGALADYFTRMFSVDLAKQGERLAEGGLRFYGNCRLSPGDYRVRVYLRDEKVGRYGFQVTNLRVPQFSAATLHALPPLFIEEKQGGLNVRDRRGSDVALSEPFQLGGDFLLPQVVPTLPLSKSGRVCLMVYTKPKDSAVSPFEIEARILDSSGSPHANPRVVLIGRSVPDSDGLVKVLLELGPLDLPRGDYVFQVTFRDTSDRTIHSESASNFRIS